MPEECAVHYAHSLAGRPKETWHELKQHLDETAQLAESFAKQFAPGWGRLAGLWHDTGKYQRSFQRRISDPDAHIKVDHSSVGALIAKEHKSGPLAFVIAGHHGGLANASDLLARLNEKGALLEQARVDGLPVCITRELCPIYPRWLEEANDPAAISFWTRFLFSALVDADFLDTERFYGGGAERDLRPQKSLQDLKTRLDEHLSKKMLVAERTPVNAMRQRVLDACRKRAGNSPGVFTLTVPTGGGKTFASLAFALEHAVQHGLHRVIVVIPFTSIIEQTVKEYREALGEDAVVEHHSNVDPDQETHLNRIASENWDAPVVVTTSVQFFESLFANRPARCRKLHRIAGSIVVFDEVQTFPVHLLAAVKYALRELAQHYRSTLLLCTATQPVLLDNAQEILPEPEKEFAVVAERCQVAMPANEDPVSWEALAIEIQGHGQVMAIVHRRDDAQRLAQLVGDDCLHLSARMCAAHRSAVLQEVKRRLLAGEPCRLVATQLVEAGVDVDFPEVYRAFAGADSLAQAAGRCNREGRGQGTLHVFIPPSKPPRGILQTAEGVARVMWREGSLDLKHPATFDKYFSRLYLLSEQDAKSIMAAEREQRFRDVGDDFRIIDEAGYSVVAPYGDWQVAVEDMRARISRQGMRRLQRFMVNLYRQEIDALDKAGALEHIQNAFWAIHPGFHVYSDRWGFGWQGPILIEPEDLIA